jgi:hypothetical protein
VVRYGTGENATPPLLRTRKAQHKREKAAQWRDRRRADGLSTRYSREPKPRLSDEEFDRRHRTAATWWSDADPRYLWPCARRGAVTLAHSFEWAKPPALLAVAATSTAVALSVLAGWQRGGWLAERVPWVCIGAVRVRAAHLLPALCRACGRTLRGIGGALWLCCMVTACYGHAMFFLTAQRRADEAWAAHALPPLSISLSGVSTAVRPLTLIAHNRAATVARPADAHARWCSSNCATLEARHSSLAARLEALDTEATEARRQEAAQDRAEARRDTARADSVTAPLAALLGVPAARLDLLAGFAFAALL